MSRPKRSDRIRPLERALHRVGDAERRLRQAAASGLGLGQTDFDALLLLDEAGALSAGRMAEALALTTGAVTGLVDRLERSGWVERTKHPTDRRQILVELASARRDVIDAHRTMREKLLATALAEVDDAALSASVALLERAAEGLLASAMETSQAVRGEEAAEGAMRAPIGSITRGRLRFASGVPRLVLRSARISDLYRAEPTGRTPEVRLDADGTVTFRYKGLGWFAPRDTSLALTLTRSVPWAIEIRGGVSDLDADLRELEVESIAIQGGASSCAIRLPRPRGACFVRVKGGANHVAIRRPRGSLAQAIVRGGANSLAFDDQRVGSVGGTVRLASSGFEGAEDAWTIELTGGASDLSVVQE